jgi:hypothetical protein
VAQFGGAARCALAGGGCCCSRPRTGPSHCARVGWAAGGSVWWVPKVKTRASGGPLQRGVGLVGRGGGGLCCGRLCPGSLVAIVASRNQTGSVVSSRITRCCGAVSCDLTPPNRSDWLRPPTATREPGQPRLWEGVPAPCACRHAAACACGVDRVHTTGRGCVLGPSPRRRAQPSWPGRWCQVARNSTTAACDPT